MRRGILFALLLLIVIGSFGRPALAWKWQEERKWIDPKDEVIFTPDKQAHFIGGVGWMTIGCHFLQDLGVGYGLSKILAFTTGVGAGVAKEYYYDAYRDGFSKVDVFFQALGQGVAAAFFVHPHKKVALVPGGGGVTLTFRW